MSISSVTSAGGANAVDPSSPYKQSRADFQALGAALQSGDIASAQQAFAQLQKDNPRLAQALNSPASSSDTPRLADLKSLASALKSGDVSASQQAFAKLQQDVQSVAGKHHGHHHQHAASATDATGTSTDGTDSTSAPGSMLNASA